MKRLRRLFNNQKGFTLVELLAVIVILGIIAAIAIPSIGSIIDNSKKDAHVSNAEMLMSAARLAVASNDTDLWSATTGDKDTNINMAELVSDGYLENTIEDPDTGEAYAGKGYVTYNPNSASGTDKYSVYLEGSKRFVGTKKDTVVNASDLDRNVVFDLN